MPSSVIFSKDSAAKRLITPALSFWADAGLSRYAKALLPVLLLIGIAVYTQGCAANKCDCPKFGGQHLKH